jgi:hypothetical protein
VSDLFHLLIGKVFARWEVDGSMVKILLKVGSLNPDHLNLFHDGLFGCTYKGMIQHFGYSLLYFFQVIPKCSPESFTLDLIAGH